MGSLFVHGTGQAFPVDISNFNNFHPRAPPATVDDSVWNNKVENNDKTVRHQPPASDNVDTNMTGPFVQRY